MQLESFLEQSARQWPDRTALVCGDRRLSYADLETAANRLAHGLLAVGVERGDRVAVYLDNGVEAVVSIFAVLKAGAAIMMVNPATRAEKLVYLLNNSRARVLILPGRQAAAMEDRWALTPHLARVVTVGRDQPAGLRGGKTHVSLDALVATHNARAEPPPKQAIDADLAALIYTSGSTGNPKGAMLTHLNLVSATASIAAYLENVQDDVILSVLPLSFGYGLSQILTAAKAGASVVLERSFAYPHQVLETLARRRATGMPIVPTIAAILLQMELGRYDLSSLRYLTSAAAALPTAYIAQLREAMPKVRLYSMYGLTECTRVTFLPPEELDRRADSVGRGMPNEEVCVVDAEGRRVGPGVVGELVVRGSHVMRGYWELPEETDRMLRPGPLPGEKVLYTGDLFRADEEGFLYFVARKDDVIKSRGAKISPREVENVLCSHADVGEAAVMGVPHPIFGEAVMAIVTLKPGRCVTERELLRHCAAHLEDFMVPQTVEFRDSMPRSSNGKIDKRALCGVAT